MKGESQDSSLEIPRQEPIDQKRLEQLTEIEETVLEELAFCEQEAGNSRRVYELKVRESIAAIIAGYTPSAVVESGIKALMNLKLMLMHQTDLEHYTRKNFKRGASSVSYNRIPEEQKEHLRFLSQWQQDASNFLIGHTDYSDEKGQPGPVHQSFINSMTEIVRGEGDLPPAEQTLEKIYGVSTNKAELKQVLDAQWFGAVGAATAVDILRLISVRDLTWSDSQTDINHKIDLFAESRKTNEPSWAIQVKATAGNTSGIWHAREARRKATSKKQVEEIESFITGADTYEGEVVPILLLLGRKDPKVLEVGKIDTKSFLEFKKQLDSAVK